MSMQICTYITCKLAPILALFYSKKVIKNFNSNRLIKVVHTAPLKNTKFTIVDIALNFFMHQLLTCAIYLTHVYIER